MDDVESKNINEQIKNNKIEEKNHKNNININDYELEIKTQEDQQTYDEFYKMNHNNRKSVGNTHNNKRNNKNNIINNKELKGIINISQNESQRKVVFKTIERKAKKIVKDM